MGCCFGRYLDSHYQDSLLFNPPKTCLYYIKSIHNYNKNRNNFAECIFSHKFFHIDSFPWIKLNSYIYRKPDKNNLVIIHLINKNTSTDAFNFIFSSRNFTDLSSNLPILLDMVNIIAYDYSGFGRSTGIPSEININKDIKEVVDFAVKDLFLNINKIILIGDSLGSFPTLSLALDRKYLDIAGLILISPISNYILSSDSIKTNSVYEFNDFYSNVNKISDINCPIFIIQGQNYEINISENMLDFTKKIRLLYKWYPKCRRDYPILLFFRTKFILKCKFFLELVKEGLKKKNTIGPDKSVIIKTKTLIFKENYIDNKNSDSDIDETTLIIQDDKVSLYSKMSNNSSVCKIETIPRSEKSNNSQKFSVVNLINEKEVEDQIKIFNELQHTKNQYI